MICVFFIPDLPVFGGPIHNVTIPMGRDAVLACVVENLQTYKVMCYY